MINPIETTNTQTPTQCSIWYHLDHSSPILIILYFLLVKSVSSADEPLSLLRLQLHASITTISFCTSCKVEQYDLPSARFPQAQVLVGSLFSVVALSQAVRVLVRTRIEGAYGCG